MSEYILDNLKGQEIKELMVNGKITLKDLDTTALNKLLDYETDMLCLDEGDMDLIHACASRLDELNGPAMSDEEFLAAIKKAEEDYVSGNRNALPAKPVKRRFISKKIWIVAAAIALFAAMATVTASAFGFNVFEYFKEVIGLPAGGKIDKDTITLVNNGNVEEYDSIEELLLTEKIDILYPSMLPDGIKIKSVSISVGQNGRDIIEFIANDSFTYISADINAEPPMIEGYKEQMVIGECTFYVFCDGDFYAVSYYNNCYYYIGSDSYENLILIINNMRETK